MTAEPLLVAIEEAISSIRALLSSLAPEDWLRQTPCEEWNVRQLLAHQSSGVGPRAGIPSPQPPEGWTTEHTGLNALTSMSVAARESWSADQVLDEYVRGTDALLDELRSLDDEGWERPAAGPPGVRNLRQLVYIALMDGFVHLQDYRVALGQPISLDAEPTALDLSIARAIELTPWGSVKRAFLPEGFRCGLRLVGAHALDADLIIADGRGSFVEPDPSTDDRVEGTTSAYFFVVTGRPQWADRAGSIRATGPQAQRLLDEFVIWAR